MNDSKTINISTSTILRIVLMGLFLVFLFLIREVIVIFVFALIIASAITPVVNVLEKIKIPRVIGALLIYILVLCFLAFLIYLVVPTIAKDVGNLSTNLPNYVEKLSDKFNYRK